MSYQSSLDALYKLQRFGIKLGLDTTRKLLASIGNPHHHFKTVHVAGTNGKGSTAAILASILRSSGYKTGLYTSPHLVDFSERIQHNGRPIAHQQVSALIDKVRASCETSPVPTFFEFATAVAFLHFAETETEIAIIEVGMGGQFDATNVIDPFATIITNIGLDHQQYLGDTIEAIAKEKAGIIKRETPVVLGNVSPQALPVIQKTSVTQHAPLVQFGRDFQVRETQEGRFDFSGHGSSYSDLNCALVGRHQLENASCALATVECLRDFGMTISESSIRRGLSDVQWSGRLEIVATHPTVILDGAHNPSAAVALAEYCIEHQKTFSGKLIFVISMQKDKDIAAFFTPLLPLAYAVVLTSSAHTQSASTEELYAQLPMQPGRLVHARSAHEAILKAYSIANREDTICATGSLFLIGEIKAAIEGADFFPIRG